MPKALIVSLGGTIDPIIKSIEEHKPDYLFFFLSKESNANEYPKVRAYLDEKRFSPKIDFSMVKDIDDLVHCYERASELASEIEKQGIPSKDVVVDYTGGTKTMSAAIVLATVTKGFRFSYVGGEKRTKKGLGVVKSGFEEVKTGLSPWQVLAVEERKKIALFFNSYQFSAAKNIAERLAKVLSGLDKALHESLSVLIEGYRLWDSFNHAGALKILSQAQKKLSEYLGFKEDLVLSEFVKSVVGNLDFLGKIQIEKYNMVFDLFDNAKRRAEEGKYDDAVARLYRALEMIGQIEFEKKFGCSTSDAKSEKLPESLREEIVKKHMSTDGKIKIPLFDTFRILTESGNKYGSTFFANQKEIGNVLEARNSSILAHGINPIPKERYEKLSTILEDFLKHTGLNYKVEFPKLRWE